MRQILALLALAMLASCGNDAAGPATGEFRGLLRGVGGRTAPADLRQSLTPQAIARVPGPLLFVEVLGNGVQAGLQPGPRNGPVQQWNTVDGASLSLHAGVLTASRGLGGDLISADVEDVVAALGGGRGSGERVHRYLTHENRLEIRAFRCTYTATGSETVTTLAGTFKTRRIEEQCFDAKGTEIVNLYWLDSSGEPRKSRQWLGPLAGYLEIERLKDQ